MNLKNLILGKYKKRVNRFVVEIELEDSRLVLAHLANTGRMTELLIESAEVLIEESNNPNRKTAYNLLFVKNLKGNWIMLKANYANDLFFSWLNSDLLQDFSEVTSIEREVKVNHSRFDFKFKQKDKNWLVEVKSVNYFDNNNAIFPDAPTKRGAKHILELIELSKKGYNVAVVFILMGESADSLFFNDKTDKIFVEAISSALSNGILIKAYQADFSKTFPFYNKKSIKIGGSDGNLCVSRL